MREAGEKVSVPILRWAGSKRRLLPKLAEYWNRSGQQRYLEPFAGSGALYFYLQPKIALLNDINSDLIETYRQISASPEQIFEAVSKIPANADTYYKIRSAENSELDNFQRAVRFIYLNRHCFNGIYRTNKAGKFNVPYGAEGAGALPSRERFSKAAALLRNIELTSDDFQIFLQKNVKEGDFVYLDPPYAVANRRVFHQYDPNTFGIGDVERLGEILDLIDERGAGFVVSYAFSGEITGLSKKWQSKRVVTQRNVAGFSQHRRKAVEVMISNL